MPFRMKDWARGVLVAAVMSVVATPTGAEPPPKKYALGVVIHGVKPKYALGDEVRLGAKVNWKGPKAEFTYRWSTVTGPSLPYNADSRSPKLVIGKGELSAGAQYQVRLEVTAEYQVEGDDEGDEPVAVTTTADSTVQFVANEPPAGGRCEMDVKWQGTAGAAVVISAPDWTDSDKIQYRYYLLRNGKPMQVKNWSQQDKTATSTLARPGDTLQARCEVRDELGDGLKELSKQVKRSN